MWNSYCQPVLSGRRLCLVDEVGPGDSRIVASGCLDGPGEDPEPGSTLSLTSSQPGTGYKSGSHPLSVSTC